MRKRVFIALVLSLLVGVPLMVLDLLHKNDSTFFIPEGFQTIAVDLSTTERIEELILERELLTPSNVEIRVQSDSLGLKHLKVLSNSGILGHAEDHVDFLVERYTGPEWSSVNLLLPPGKYAVYLTSPQEKGQLVLNYREVPTDQAQFERLFKIHGGDLNHPPAQYKEVFSTELTGRQLDNEVVYEFSFSSRQSFGLSAYTSATKGMVSVDLIGEGVSWIGLVSPENRICDQLEITLNPGTYEIRVSCSEADGALNVFVKDN